MEGLSIWHWIIVFLILVIPAAFGLIVWLIARASKRSSVMPPAVPASQVPSEKLDPSNPYAAPPSFQSPQTLPVAPTRLPSKPRPWVRYWARMFDMYLACLVGGVAIGIVSPSAFNGPGSDQLLGLGVIFAWVFIESLLLSTAGITPGKWLLRTRVTSSDGVKPNYTAALSRSFKVWWRGLGIGFPLASLITLIVAHGNLARDGITTWDRDDGFVVVHERIGPLRVIAAVLFFFGFLVLALVGSALGA